jgi:hypothetical protein
MSLLTKLSPIFGGVEIATGARSIIIMVPIQSEQKLNIY